MLRGRTLERRLFGWLFVLTVVPAVVVLLGGVWVGARALNWTGSLGPWQRVADSGRQLLDAVAPVAKSDPALAHAAAQHRAQLSQSLTLARRWVYLGRRLESSLPVLALGLSLILAILALLVSRRLARELARPIEDVVGWSERLAREDELPAPQPSESREVREVRALREALRRAAAERVLARGRALEAERTRVWGEMARRVAHEMKNPLTPLRLAAHRLRGLSSEAPALEEPVHVIEQETLRLEDLAAQFSELGRPPEGPASPVDLEELLTSMLATDVPRTITCELESPGRPVVVEAHYDALLRAFRNLVKNAVEAMLESSDEGRLTVRLAAPQAGSVEVSIADTGPGLPPGAESRIFEPDFTTKSRGTGLGLALVRQTVRRAGGDVTARSASGGGAEFVVRLPAPGAAAEA